MLYEVSHKVIVELALGWDSSAHGPALGWTYNLSQDSPASFVGTKRELSHVGVSTECVQHENAY